MQTVKLDPKPDGSDGKASVEIRNGQLVIVHRDLKQPVPIPTPAFRRWCFRYLREMLA